MPQSAQKLLLQIARNPEPQEAFDALKKGKDVQSPYKKIVQNQIDLGVKKMHLPEPWNGHISKAKILFISSNPSIGVHEDFPTKDWEDDEIIGFFENRFTESDEGSESTFWKFIAKNTSWIFPEAEGMSTLKILDKYVAMTEIVHCKSKHETGIKECLACEAPFLPKILREFKGSIVIFVGDSAKEYYASNKNLFSGTSFKIAEIFHQNARKKGLTDEERKTDLLRQLKK